MKGLTYFCKENWVLLYVKRWLRSGVMQKDGELTDHISGTPQGGVISPLLANIFLHIAIDKWMEREHPGNPFERYADDIVMLCKTEKQALGLCKEVANRLEACKLQLHLNKTKVVNLRGRSWDKYPRKFDFLGYTFRPTLTKTRVGFKVMIAPRMGNQSMKIVTKRIRVMRLHRWRKTIDNIAKELRPMLRGVINYYCKYSRWETFKLWRGINARLLKWVKWEKRLYKNDAVK